MNRPVVGAFSLVALALALSPSVAEDDFMKSKATAIDKGAAWLKKAQGSDGSWDYDDKPFAIMTNTGAIHMKQGTTALGAYALLKSGTVPDDPVIKKAFEFMQSCQIEHVYSAGCVLLAIEARYNWEPPREDESGDGVSDNQTHEKKAKSPPPKKIKPSAKDIELAGRCVEFLHKTQQRNTWRYPQMDSEDASNAQYALLGLDAAERLSIPVPKEIYEKAQEYFVYNQEKDGPNVAPFPVPGADLSYKELKAIEKEMREKLKQINGQFKGKKPGDTNEAGHTEEDERRTTEEDASKKVLKTVSGGQKMRARGWAYAYPPIEKGGGGGEGTQGGNGGRGGGGGANAPLDHWKTIATGSMTASGLACLFICKAHLDGTTVYNKQLKGPIDKALRDGAAWLALHFSVGHNPSGADSADGGEGGGGRGGRGGRGGGGGGGGGERFIHHYYYMYGLERAGILGLIPKFGEHDWYDDGCHVFVKAQKADGSWDAGLSDGTVGPTCDTCFALLFLARGTTPVVRIPTRTATGQPQGAQPQPQPQPQGGVKPGADGGKPDGGKPADEGKGGEGEGKGKEGDD